jgi:shikimate kinase
MTDPAMRPLLLLWGLMGTGKSTVGRLLAARTPARFTDLDELVEAEAGRSIAEVFATGGEAAFRAIEARLLAAILDRASREAPRAAPKVVALGGGALLDAAPRSRALALAFVVCLTAPPALIARRTAASARPLLGEAGDRLARIERLLGARGSAYAEAHLALAAEAPADEVASLLANAWRGWR